MRRAVVVTGASSGIGQCLALGLARAGFDVFGTVRDDAAADELRRASGSSVTPLLLDVTDAGQIAEAAATVAAGTQGHGLYALVNNAGIDLPGPLEHFPMPDLRRQMDVNVLGLVAVTQAFLPMLTTARGRVVNIGSISARVVMPFNGPYSASKAALAAITSAWRGELRLQGVEVCLVEAGNIRSPIWAKVQRSVEQATPAGAPTVYAAALARAAKLVTLAERHAADPRVVLTAVRRALEDSRPRACYAAGLDAVIWPLLVRLLPERVVAAGFHRILGLNRASRTSDQDRQRLPDPQAGTDPAG